MNEPDRELPVEDAHETPTPVSLKEQRRSSGKGLSHTEKKGQERRIKGRDFTSPESTEKSTKLS